MQQASDTLTIGAATALEKDFERVTAQGPRDWAIGLGPSRSWQGRAWLTDRLLCLRLRARTPAPGRRAANGEFWRWLDCNQHLQAGVKIFLDGNNGVMLGADIPLGPEPELAMPVQAVSRGFRAAAAAVETETPVENFLPFDAPASHDVLALTGRVKEACEGAGWPCVKREKTGDLAVPLEVQDDFCQARVMSRREREMSLITDIWTLDPSAAPAECRAAAAVFMLSVSGNVPMVRAIVETNGNITIGAECVLVGAVTADGLNHALCALSMFCRHTRKEVKALQGSKALAAAYLAIRGYHMEP